MNKREIPPFYVSKNLMGYGPGMPDGNKRFVHRWPPDNDDEVAVFKASDPKAGWTETDNRAVDAYVKVLLEETSDASHLEARG